MQRYGKEVKFEDETDVELELEFEDVSFGILFCVLANS